MTISASAWKKYINTLSRLSREAADAMRQYVASNGLNDRKTLIDMAYALVTRYGEGSSELACEMYDAVAQLSGVSLPSAEPAPTATYRETAIAVNGSLKQSPTGQILPQVADRLVKQAAADTTLKNAKRDNAEWAWIPNGDTCAFCLTLASRGWQPASRAQLKGNHATHIHANCDCEFAIRFNSSTNYSGYDPDRLYEEYQDASDGSAKDKINSLRRMHYASHKDEINAQKRAAYRQRTGDMPVSEYALAVETWSRVNELGLPGSEKEHVYEELDNNLSADEKQSALVHQEIDNYRYYAVNKGHNQYKIYKKEPIDRKEDIVDEVLSEMFGDNWKEEWEQIQK